MSCGSTASRGRLPPRAARLRGGAGGRGGRPASAAREALALFRGDPLGDVADEPFADAEIRRLEELRLAAAELAIDADLAAGRHQELVGEIEALLAENPLRERLHAQRMLALYRCGRQAEALEAYRHARRRSSRRSASSRAGAARLHDAILRQDPSLDVEPAVAELPRELDATASPPLIGRDDELRRLRALWRRAAAGAGALVTLVGAYGMGKTRLAAELAARRAPRGRDGALRGRDRAARGRAGGDRAGARDAGARRCSSSTTPTARPPRSARALRELGRGSPRAGAGARHRAGGGGARAARAAESIVLEPLDADGVRAIAGFYAPAGGGERSRSRRCSPPAAGSRAASTRRRASGRGARRHAASTRSPNARPPGAARRARWRPSWPAASSSCSRRASARGWSPATASDAGGRWSAPTRASRRSTPTTPSTSSGASGSSPSWSRGSSARRCSRSSARRAAASPR